MLIKTHHVNNSTICTWVDPLPHGERPSPLLVMILHIELQMAQFHNVGAIFVSHIMHKDDRVIAVVIHLVMCYSLPDPFSHGWTRFAMLLAFI
jgi:hypothetical protein